jgi:hypothetical protein
MDNARAQVDVNIDGWKLADIASRNMGTIWYGDKQPDVRLCDEDSKYLEPFTLLRYLRVLSFQALI